MVLERIYWFWYENWHTHTTFRLAKDIINSSASALNWRKFLLLHRVSAFNCSICSLVGGLVNEEKGTTFFLLLGRHHVRFLDIDFWTGKLKFEKKKKRVSMLPTFNSDFMLTVKVSAWFFLLLDNIFRTNATKLIIHNLHKVRPLNSWYSSMLPTLYLFF